MSIAVSAQIQVKPIPVSKTITALQNTRSGVIDYGTENGETGHYDGLKFTREHSIEGQINSILIEGNTKTYLTSEGLYVDKDRDLKLTSRANLDVMAKSADHTFLVTSTGVYRLENRDYQPDKEDFFNINEIEYGSYFELGNKDVFRVNNRVFIKDKIWKELIIHAEKDFSILPWNSKQMIVCDRNSLVTFDHKGYVDTLYTLQSETPNKVFKISNSKLLLCANDSIGIFDVRKRSLNNFYQIKTDLIEDVTVDNWGNIWIAAGSYLYQVIDQSNAAISDPPNVKIDAIRIDGQLQEYNSTYSIRDEVNDIEIEYSGVHMTFPQNLEFETLFSSRHYSLGYNSSDSGEWIKATKAGSVEYRNLAPGKYTFQVRGSIDGINYMYTKPIEFTVESDLFLSVWLMGIIGGIGVLLLALYFNYRYNSLKEKSLRDRDKLIQENKMLSLQQKALQLQMNPHFVFNALNSIQGLIAKNDNQKSRRYLQEFSTMMRSVLNQSRSETIELSDEISYLKSYLSLEQMANNDRFDWSVHLNPDVEDDIRIPTMIIQPFVENAIIHGVRSLKERRGKIQLFFKQAGNTISVEIVDNGIGRKASAKVKSSKHQSVAIDVVKERLSSKRASSRGNPIVYTDLMDEVSGKPAGTKVNLSIPIMG